MKNSTRLLVAALLTLTAFAVQAQQYYPMLRTDVLWEVDFGQYDGLGESHHSMWHWVESNIDTTVNGLTYNLVENTYQLEQLGYLREDTALQHVYQLDSSGADILLYDFTMEIGDSINARIRPGMMPDTFKQWVTDISTIMVDGTSRRYWSFENNSPGSNCNLHWIEGVGSTRGPMRNWEDDCWHTRYDLICFRNTSAGIHNAMWGDFCTPLSTSVEQEARRLSVYPNPASNQLRLETDDSIGSVRIFNAMGKQVLHQQHDFWQTEQTLDIATLPPGMYVLIAETPAGQVRRKISIFR